MSACPPGNYPGRRSSRGVLLAALAAAAGCGDDRAGDARDAAPDLSPADAPGASDAADAPPVPLDPIICGPSERSVIYQLAFSTDGKRLAVALSKGDVVVLDLAAGRPTVIVARLSLGIEAPFRIALTEDGSVLAAAAAGSVKLWQVADGRLLRQLDVGSGGSVSLKFSDAPAPLLLAGFERSANPADNVKIWRISDAVLVGSLRGSPHATFTYADEAVLLVDEAGGGFQVVSFLGRMLRQASFPQPLALTAFAPDGAYLGGVTGAGGAQERVAIMSVADDSFVWQSTETNTSSRRLLFLENPSRVLQLGKRVLVLDHDGGKLLATLPAQVATASAATAVSPDGASVAVVSGEGSSVTLYSTSEPDRPAELLYSCARLLW